MPTALQPPLQLLLLVLELVAAVDEDLLLLLIWGGSADGAACAYGQHRYPAASKVGCVTTLLIGFFPISISSSDTALNPGGGGWNCLSQASAGATSSSCCWGRPAVASCSSAAAAWRLALLELPRSNWTL